MKKTVKNSTYEINQCFGAHSIPVVKKGQIVTFNDNDSKDASAKQNAEYEAQLKAYIAKAKEDALKNAFQSHSIHKSTKAGSVANNQGIVTINNQVISDGTQQPQYNVQTKGMRK